jgi:hypothetical protein
VSLVLKQSFDLLDKIDINDLSNEESDKQLDLIKQINSHLSFLLDVDRILSQTAYLYHLNDFLSLERRGQLATLCPL